jgi:hypothetical protein
LLKLGVQRKPFIFSELSKLLVATGKSFSKSIEVVNLDASKPNLVCDNLPGFPVGVEGGTGQLFQGTTPIICGGARPNRFVDSCDCYGLKNAFGIKYLACRNAADFLQVLWCQLKMMMRF